MKRFSVVIAVISAALFGVATPFSKLLLRELNTFQLAGLLYLGAAAGLFPIMVVKHRITGYRINGANVFRVSGTIVFGGILGPVFLLLGLRLADASSTALWLNLELAATAVLGWLFFKDHLDMHGWLGVTGAILAGVLLAFHEGQSGILAALFVTLACICWGLDNHFTALIDAITPTQTTFLKGLTAGSVNLLIGVTMESGLASLKIVLAAIVVGIFSYGVSTVLYINASHGLGATRSQILFASAPFFGVLFSVLLLSESLSLIQIVAASVLVLSISSIILGKHAHFHIHGELEHIHVHSHNDLHHDHEHHPKLSPMKHSHLHKHRKHSHFHSHYPDLHHRHDHSSDWNPEDKQGHSE
jgi:drug/metabolite transporter (DMT)-like permease